MSDADIQGFERKLKSAVVKPSNRQETPTSKLGYGWQVNGCS